MDDEAERRARLRARFEREAAADPDIARTPGRTTLVEQEFSRRPPTARGVPGKSTLVEQQASGLEPAVDVEHVVAQARAALAGRGSREHAYGLLLDVLASHGGSLGPAETSSMMSLAIDLVASMAAPNATSHAPVQRKSSGDPAMSDAAGVAMRGVAAAGAPLPHLDRIQASFGRHDVAQVRTATGGAAGEASQALGATAYAVGDRVGFAGTPDLHTAAHEAAHVVQQGGGVQLKGGLDGGKGDPMEQHADAVADAVVRGDSAEALLDQVAGNGRSENAVQRKSEGASLHPPSGDYCNTYRIKIVAAIADRIRAVGLPKPHPRLYWTDRERAEQAIIDALRKDVEVLADKTLHRLMEHAYPADLYAIVDGVRQGASAPQQGEWHPIVGVAIANAMSEPLDASILRMAMRLRVQLDGPARGITHDAHLVPSCPLDVLVAEVLTKPGVVGGGELRSSTGDTPGKPFSRGAQPVTFRLAGQRDPKLWNWIEVTSPKHATAEDVASTELIPGKSDSVMGPAQSYRIAASPPYFGIPIEVARQVADMRDLATSKDQENARLGDFGRVADAGVLHNSEVADDAAIAQAAPAEPHTPGLERLLGRVEVQLDAVETRLAPVKATSMISGAKRFVAHCRGELSRDPKGANRFVPAVAGQEGILHAVASELVDLFAELDKHRAKVKVQGEMLPVAVSDLIRAYARAAGASHLAAEANPLLADARRQKALLPLSLVDDEIRGARDAVASQGDTDEPGADSNVRSLPKAMTDAADARLRLSRGEAVSETQVSQVNSDAIELAMRARLATLAGTVRALEQRAIDAQVASGTAPGGSWSVQKIVDMILDLIYGEEKPHSQFEGGGKLHGGWSKRLDLARKKVSEPGVQDPSGMWMQPAVSYVNGELALMDSQLGSMKDFINWSKDQIAYAKTKQLMMSMAWQIGLMIVTGEIAGAGLAAVRGIAMAGEIAEDVRGASLVWKGAEVLVHSGLQTVASGATGGEISGKAFAENALGMLLTSAAMKPFKSLLAGDAALEQTVERQLSTLGKIGKLAKAGAKIGAEAAIDVSAGVIGSGVAHAVVNNTELGIASRDEWMTQGFALAASAFVSTHTQAMHARIEVAAHELRAAKISEAAERLDALSARAEKLKARAASNKQPSPDEAGAMLVERHEILTSEQAIYQEIGGDKGAAKKNAEDLGATNSSFIEVPFQLAGLSPVVDGLSYEGTAKQVRKALAAAAQNGIDAVATRDEKGTWTVNLGDRTLTIKELDFSASAKPKEATNAHIPSHERTTQRMPAVDPSAHDEPHRPAHERTTEKMAAVDPSHVPPAAAPTKVVFTGRGDMTARAAQHLKPQPGYFDVVVHGDPNRFWILHDGEWTTVTPNSIRKMIARQPGYAGQPIRLVSCESGMLDDGIAQAIANGLGVHVIAPTETAWILVDGSVVVGHDPANPTGAWRDFQPFKAGGSKPKKPTMPSVHEPAEHDPTTPSSADAAHATRLGGPDLTPHSGSVTKEGYRLTDQLGKGGEKTVYAVEGHPEVVVGVAKEGVTAERLEREVRILRELAEKGLPVVEVLGKTEVDGRPALIMKRYAQGSKDVARTIKRAVMLVGESRFLNARSIDDLRHIQVVLEQTPLWVNDLQFLIAEDGRVVVADAIGLEIRKPSDVNIATIKRLVQAAQKKYGKEKMSWEDNVHLVPTRNEPLLRAMLGQSIQSMAHYAEGGSEALLAHEAYAMRNIMPRQLFSLANSQVVLRLGNGEALEFGSLEELASLTVEHANEKVLREYDLYPIEATDPTYSEPVFARALGRRIVAIRVLRFEVRSTPTHVMSPALEDRPREAGVVLELDDGSALLISHTMLEAPNDLGIFPAEQLVNTKLSYKEVLHLRAEPVKTSLRRVGFFRELRHGKADGPVLKEAIRGAGDPDEPKVVSYLRAGHVLMASPGIVRDVLDPRGGIIGALGILTDGTYAWPSDLVHYVERYHARLPDELIAHMASLGWRMPDHVDLSALQLFP